MSESYILGHKKTGLAVHCNDLEKLRTTVEGFCLAALSKLKLPIGIEEERECLETLWSKLVVTPLDSEKVFTPVLESYSISDFLILFPATEITDSWFIHVK